MDILLIAKFFLYITIGSALSFFLIRPKFELAILSWVSLVASIFSFIIS